MPHPDTNTGNCGSGFHTTRWSIIATRDSAPGNRQEALEWLCRSYWKPLYRHVRHKGSNHEDALDLTQGFFERLLDGEPFAGADRQHGRFRAWMLAALNHYLSDRRDRDHAAKRGNGRAALSIEEMNTAGDTWEPTDAALSPDREFDRQWAITVMDRALSDLESEYAKRGAAEQFRLLSPFLAGRPDPRSYEELGGKLGTGSNSVAVAVKRLRERFRARVRSIVHETVGSDGEVESEMACLSAALRGR